MITENPDIDNVLHTHVLLRLFSSFHNALPGLILFLDGKVALFATLQIFSPLQEWLYQKYSFGFDFVKLSNDRAFRSVLR